MKSFVPVTALALVLAGCGGSTATKVIVVTATPVPATATPQPIPTSAPAPTPTHVPAASSANGSFTDSSTGVSVTLSKVQLDSVGDQFDHPDAGKVFQVFYASIHNGGSSNNDFNALDFQFVDQQGQAFDTTTFLPNKYSPQLDSGTLAPGDTRAGWVGGQIPSNTKTITITWDNASTLSPPQKLGVYKITG